MSYKITEIASREVWDQFLDALKPHSFLHSWQWAQFQRAMGERVWRLGIYDGNELRGVALVIKVSARRGSFLFVPHGPLMLNWSPRESVASSLSAGLSVANHFATLVGFLKNLAEQEKVAFIRISPLCGKENEKVFRGHGFRPAPIHMHPERAWMLDIRPSEDELLRGMRKTTRYMIRQAEKNGVEIRESAEVTDLDLFNSLYHATVGRHHFMPFSPNYLKGEFEAFCSVIPSPSPDPVPSELEGLRINSVEGSPRADARFFFASHKGELLASAMIIFSHGSGFYHHGASTGKYPQLGAPAALQWAIIRSAKARGCELYNFWGIAPQNAPKHPWAGLTFFKQGFGGFAEEYLHAQDLALKPAYWINFGIETIRRWRRGL